MARKKWRNFYPVNESCQIIELVSGQYVDDWCIKHGKYVVSCMQCGEHFHTDRPHTKYCSAACSQKAYRERKKCQG